VDEITVPGMSRSGHDDAEEVRVREGGSAINSGGGNSRQKWPIVAMARRGQKGRESSTFGNTFEKRTVGRAYKLGRS
jgi:hypothetical protein